MSLQHYQKNSSLLLINDLLRISISIPHLLIQIFIFGFTVNVHFTNRSNHNFMIFCSHTTSLLQEWISEKFANHRTEPFLTGWQEKNTIFAYPPCLLQKGKAERSAFYPKRKTSRLTHFSYSPTRQTSSSNGSNIRQASS